MMKLTLVKLSLRCLWDIWKRCPDDIHKYSLELKNNVQETETRVKKSSVSVVAEAQRMNIINREKKPNVITLAIARDRDAGVFRIASDECWETERDQQNPSFPAEAHFKRPLGPDPA